MTKAELKTKEEQLQADARAIVATAQAEGRKLTSEEETRFDAIKSQIAEVRANRDALEARLKELSTTPSAMAGTGAGVPSMRVGKTRGRFSLLKAVNDIVNNRTLDAATMEVVERGRSQMAASGQSYGGQILMPVNTSIPDEFRALNGIITAGSNYTANTFNGGKEAVPTDTFDIITGLRGNLALPVVGAPIMTGLVGNVEIPTYSGSTVAWGTETADATNGTGTFGHVSMSPKRLTAYVDVSKQFLIQTSDTADAMLRNDLQDALAAAVESALFATANVSNAPAAIALAASASSITTAADWYSVVAALEGANMYGDFRAVLSPALKASLRGVTIDAGSGRLLFDGGYLDGYPTVVSTNEANGYGLVGVWRELVVGQWGAADITVDPYTRAAAGQVRIVVNAYFDAALRRAGALKLIKYVAPQA